MRGEPEQIRYLVETRDGIRGDYVRWPTCADEPERNRCLACAEDRPEDCSR